MRTLLFLVFLACWLLVMYMAGVHVTTKPPSWETVIVVAGVAVYTAGMLKISVMYGRDCRS